MPVRFVSILLFLIYYLMMMMHSDLLKTQVVKTFLRTSACTVCDSYTNGISRLLVRHKRKKSGNSVNKAYLRVKNEDIGVLKDLFRYSVEENELYTLPGLYYFLGDGEGPKQRQESEYGLNIN